MILSELLYINGIDVYKAFGAFLSEDSAGECSNYSALLKPAAMKPCVSVNFREEDGEKLPEELLPRRMPRDVELKISIIAASDTDFIQKYDAFVNFLCSGWLSIEVPELGKTYRMYYNSCTGYDQITPFGSASVVGRFRVKLREPKPAK